MTEAKLESETPQSYNFYRALVRLWFSITFRKIRVLGKDKLARSSAVLFAVNYPMSFLTALTFLVSLKEPVYCVLAEDSLRGLLGRILSRGLGMILYGPDEDSRLTALEKACQLLVEGKSVVVFAEPKFERPKSPDDLSVTASMVALQAEAELAGKLGLRVFPVNMLVPPEGAKSKELFIYIDAPILPGEEYSHAKEDADTQVRALAGALEGNFRENAFRLQVPDLNMFVSDLEEVLRVNLEEEWAARPNWKQSAEEFQLSGFVKDWVQQVNHQEPGRLIALRESLERYRELRRRSSLQQFEVGQAGEWMTPLKRALVLLETIAGAPAALYGFANHLLSLLVLHFAGLLKKGGERDPRLVWGLRTMIVLGCYTIQTLLAAYFVGRSAAGYYAPLLPLTGLYLWRYHWLVRNRSRQVFLALSMPMREKKVRSVRKEFVRGLNETLDAHAQTAGVLH